MGLLTDAYDEFVDGLRTALEDSSLRVVDDPAANVDRGNVVVGPPAYSWSAQCGGTLPDTMTLSIYLVEAVGERAIGNLLDRLPELLAALDTPDIAVTACAPAAFPAGASDLPAYLITAETTL